MTKTYFPFDAGPGANVAEAQWREMANLWRLTGVIPDLLNELEVYADSTGMQVKIKSGVAWMVGHFFKSDAEETLAIANAHATLGRIDRVVVQINWTANTIDIVILTGTAAASPSAPALTQTSSVYEISLAQVNVGAAVSTIAGGNITDERDYSVDMTSFLASFVAASGSEINTGTDTEKYATPAGLAASNLAWLIATAFSAASASDVSTGTATNKLMTPDSFAESERGKRYIVYQVFSDEEDVEVGDSVGRIPIPEEIRNAAYDLVDVETWTPNPGTTNSTIVQLNNGSNDVLSTRIYIDSGGENSKDAGTAAAINSSFKSLSGVKFMDVDVDQSSTTAAQGLWVKLTAQKV